MTSGRNPGGSISVRFSLPQPNTTIQGYAQAFQVPDGVVLITVKTVDMPKSVAIGQQIEATISSR